MSDEPITLLGVSSTNRTTSGILFAVTASVAFGASGPFAKALIDAGFSPLQAVWLRIVGTIAVLLVLCVATGRLGRLADLRRHRWPVLAYGLVAVAACQALYFVAASRLPVGVAILLEYLGPVLVVGWAKLVQHRHVARESVLGVVVAMAGLACVVQIWTGVQLDALGLAAGLGAAAGNAAFFLLIEHIGDQVDPLSLTTGAMIIGAVALVPLAGPWSAPWHILGDTVPFGSHAAPGWVLAAIVVLVSTVLSYLCGAAAVQRLSAPIAAGLAYIEAPATTVIAWIALGEHLSTPQMLGGMIVLGGAFLAQRGIAAGVVPADMREHTPRLGTTPAPEPLIP